VNMTDSKPLTTLSLSTPPESTTTTTTTPTTKETNSNTMSTLPPPPEQQVHEGHAKNTPFICTSSANNTTTTTTTELRSCLLPMASGHSVSARTSVMRNLNEGDFPPLPLLGGVVGDRCRPHSTPATNENPKDTTV
ncbi:hypothetical protein Ahia01_000554200, partial [Argonauta hians]